jgi:hypothetical protein
MQWLLAVLDAPGEAVIVVASFIDGLTISKLSEAVESFELGFSEIVCAKNCGQDFAQDISWSREKLRR